MQNSESFIYSKKTDQKKGQGNVIHFEEGKKNQLTGIDTEMIKILKLADKDCKCQLNITMFKHVKYEHSK